MTHCTRRPRPSSPNNLSPAKAPHNERLVSSKGLHLRGINNEGAPLVLKLKPDCVNSISAPNGVGKTSIFDAIVYAITGRIPKLEDLPAAEKGPSYYLNRFHTGGVGTVALTLEPAAGGAEVTITVQRDAAGARTVSASNGADGDAILADINREFVLLDGKTFQDFIDFSPQKRGRSFAGLLGLKRYSALRQGLASLANTKALNNHFGVAAKEATQNGATVTAQRARANIKEAYTALVADEYDPAEAERTMLAKAHSALHGVELLRPICEGRTFEEIDPSACVDAAKTAEGGEAREQLAKILRDQTSWIDAAKTAPSEEDAGRLIELADARDTALQVTQGDLFHQLYGLSETILADDSWADKCVCPACDRLDTIRFSIMFVVNSPTSRRLRRLRLIWFKSGPKGAGINSKTWSGWVADLKRWPTLPRQRTSASREPSTARVHVPLLNG